MKVKVQVIIESDGEDAVRDLQLYLNRNAEHILDWFQRKF